MGRRRVCGVRRYWRSHHGGYILEKCFNVIMMLRKLCMLIFLRNRINFLIM